MARPSPGSVLGGWPGASIHYTKQPLTTEILIFQLLVLYEYEVVRLRVYMSHDVYN